MAGLIGNSGGDEQAGDGAGVDTTLRRRDAAAVVAGLEAWLPKVLQGASAPRVGALTTPTGAGFSNETYLFEVSWPEGGRERREALVVQAAPIGDALFQSYALDKMFALQRALGERRVPTPKMRWYEGDARYLGSAFYVMDAVPGEVPADNPSYMAEGFVFDAPESERRAMWSSALEAMAALHRIAPDTLDAQLRASLGAGEDPVAERLAFWDRFVAWASPDPLPLHEEGLRWLRANRPHPKPPLSVTWGDPKLANIIFSGGEARALIDWELCGVGYAEEDLAHFLWMAHYACVNCGAERLPGIASRDESIERYAKLLERDLEALDWWSTFSIFRLSAICHRIMHQVRALGGIPAEVDIGTINPITQFLREELERVA